MMALSDIILNPLLPAPLCYALFALLALIFCWILLRDKARAGSRKTLLFCLRVLMAALLCLLLLNPGSRTGPDNFLIDDAFVFDCSASVTPERFSEWTNHYRQNFNQAAQPAFAAFGKDFVSVSANTELSRAGICQDFAGPAILTDYTTLLANELKTKQLYLYSDGLETRNSIVQMIRESTEAQMQSYPRINPIALGATGLISPELLISRNSNELLYLAGRSYSEQIVLENQGRPASDVQIRVLQNDQELIKQTVKIATDSQTVLDIKTKDLKAGVNKFLVETDRQSYAFYLTAKKNKQFLILGSRQQENDNLAKMLRALKIEFQTKVIKNKAELPDLSNFSAVVLNNISAKKFSSSQIKELTNFVLEQGQGLLMVGGNESFGLGGWQNTGLDKILPVTSLDPKREKKRVNVAVELVLDKSGSMNRDNKVDFTRLAAKGVINALKPEDYLGLIAFDSQPFIALNITQLKGGGRDKALQRVGLILPNGTTNLYPAMDAARRELELARAGRKHMIILTDGRLPDRDQMRSSYVNLAASLKATGTTVSTFIIGGDSSVLLADIAKAGGGKYHQTRDASSLPKLFLDDVRVSTGESTQKENTQFDLLHNNLKQNITSIKQYPQVAGYVVTKQKPTANNEVTVINSKNSNPLLAHWKTGKGRVVALTTDLSARWTRGWLSWSKFGQFQADMFAALQAEKTAKYRYDLNASAEKSVIDLQLVFASPTVSPQDFALTVLLAQSGQTKEKSSSHVLDFRVVSPGVFTAQLPYNKAGTAELFLKFENSEQEKFKIELPDPLIAEQTRGVNRVFLDTLAALTGGEVLGEEVEQSKETTASDTSFAGPEQDEDNTNSWFYYLLILFALVFAGEVLLRERSS